MPFLLTHFVRPAAAVLVLASLNACGSGSESTDSPPPATHLLVKVPAAALARSPLPISVTALDASNNPAATYNGSVVITSSDGRALLPTVTVQLSSGSGGFSATLESVGMQTLTATDAGQPSIAGTSSPITVSAAGAIVISSSPPPAGVVGSEYNAPGRRHCHPGGPCSPYQWQLSGSGGIGDFTWTWAAAPGSSLPPGLSLAGNLIGGTPPIGSVGSYSVIITATDFGTPAAQASVPYTITIVNPPPPLIAALPGPPGATLHQPYSFRFQFSGFAPVTISENGALPPGFAALPATGLLNGTPTKAGLYPITVHASDAAGQDSSQAFTIGVFQNGFVPTGGMRARRLGHTATLLASGQVLVTGGQQQYATESTSELFTPKNGSFAMTGALQVPRVQHTATLLCDLAAPPCVNPKVLVVGGFNDTEIAASAELYDSAAGTFALTAGSLATARYGHTATLLQSGKVLIAGGILLVGSPSNGHGVSGVVTELASAELYDPATGTFSETAAPMTSARFGHTATLLADGRVLIAGGVDANSVTLASAELYDPVAGTFSTIPGTLTTARSGHTATLLAGGRVLIAGGDDSAGAAELYDPTAVAPAASFTATGALVTPRAWHTAVRLPSDQVLVVGGLCQGQALQHAELYDPTSGLFASTGGMQTARINHTLTSLGTSGQMLVVGGNAGDGGEGFSTAEIYQ